MTIQINDIIIGCKAGKLNARTQLYKLYAKKMFAVCLLYTKDYTAAEDVVQDGFIKIYEKIGQFKNKGSFEGWIRRIMVNTALERYRRQQYMHSVEEIEIYSKNSSYDELMDTVTAKELIKLIQELSPQYRIVFSLYAIEGYSHKEISDKLNISVSTSKSNLSRARKILRAKVTKQYGIVLKESRVIG